jgi:hypothetical protein
VKKKLADLLKGGDRRSIGRANEVAATIAKTPQLFPELISNLWSEDPVARMRAADAAEKVSRDQPRLLRPHKRELLGLLAEARQQELRWHLAAMIPRLELTPAEHTKAADALEAFLDDRSSIVKTFALQGLADLAALDPRMREGVIEKLREATRTGTPAMKARSRKLLAKLERLEAESNRPTGTSRQSS